MKKIKNIALVVLLFSVLLALVAITVYGQQDLGRMSGRGGSSRGPRGELKQNYDPSQAVVINGEVSVLTNIDSGKMSGAGLELATSEGTVLVFLGPHIYVDLQRFRISVGDRVRIKGVRSMAGERSIFMAGEVRKGEEVLLLRDDKGAPLWALGGSRQGRDVWN